MQINLNRAGRSGGSWLLFFASAVLLGWPGLLPAADAPGLLVELPVLALDDLNPQARGVVGPAIARFEKDEANLEGAELGQAYGRLAMAFHAHQLEASARAAYSNAINLDPDDAHWPYYLALILESSDDNEQALRYFRRSYELDRQYPNALLRSGGALIATNRHEEARQAFETVRDKFPALAATALVGISTVAMLEENYQQEADALERALALQPEATRLHRRLADIYTGLGDTEKATLHRQQSGDGELVIEDGWFDVLMARQYGSNYFVRQGVQAVQQGQIEQALQTFMLALSINPQDADALAHMALALGFGERREDSVGLVDKALDIDPAHGLANSLKGTMLTEAGDDEAAQAFYFRAVSAEPGNVEFRQQFANGLMRLGDYTAAARQYGEASRMRPDHLMAHYSLAVALSMADRCADAMTAIEQAVALNPLIALSLNARARIFSTCPASTVAQREAVLSDAMQLYEQRPDATHSETAAMALAANGRFDEAMEFQGQAIFEAIKAGDQKSQAGLRTNMKLYEAMQAAKHPWPAQN